MEKAVLHATRRTVLGKQVGQLRRQGKLPAIMYGHNIEPTPISMDLHTSSQILDRLTASSLITIELDGIENAALVREKQRDYIRGTLIHIDFQIVSLTEKLRATVSIVLSGLSPAVKDFNGVVVSGLDEIEVECLPQDLPERIVVDISNLRKIGDGIYVRDLVVAENVEILENSDEMIVIVTATAAEEEEVVEEAVSTEEPEIIEKGKKEEEEKE